MQLPGKMLFRNASTLSCHILASWNKVITKVLLCPVSHMKFPFANCTAPSPLPLPLYPCLHLFHMHWYLRMCFITNCFPLSGSKTSEICWHFWSCLTTHHFLSNCAQWAFHFPGVSINFLADHSAWDEKSKPVLISGPGLSSIKHKNCPFAAKELRWVQMTRHWGGCRGSHWDKWPGLAPCWAERSSYGWITTPHSPSPCTAWGVEDQEWNSEAKRRKRARKGIGLIFVILFLTTLIYFNQE